MDDDPEYADLTADFLSRADERMVVETAGGPEGALARLGGSTVDCVVSDFDVHGMDGIELLRAVREAHPDLPFILFTGKGSEEVASEATSGATRRAGVG